MNEVADRLNTTPAERRAREETPGDLRQLVGLAVATSTQEDQRLLRKLLDGMLGRRGARPDPARRCHVRGPRRTRESRRGGRPGACTSCRIRPGRPRSEPRGSSSCGRVVSGPRRGCSEREASGSSASLGEIRSSARSRRRSAWLFLLRRCCFECDKAGIGGIVSSNLHRRSGAPLRRCPPPPDKLAASRAADSRVAAGVEARNSGPPERPVMDFLTRPATQK